MASSFARYLAPALLAALAVAGSAWAQTAPTAPASAPASTQAGSPNVQITQRLLDEPTRRVVKLSNGLTVIVQQNKTAPVVAARVYIKAGSLTEQEYMGAGISHVLEHLVAGASSQKKNEAESQQLLRVLGGDSNAYTSYDQTCYFITTTAEKWPAAMELLADWTTGADFTEEQFQREYQVVQREIEMGESEAARTFYKLLYANRYQVHPAQHPVIGYKVVFQKLTAEDCRKYYQRMYVPDNMIVSVAGDVDLDAATKIVQDSFAAVTRKRAPVVSLPAEPPVVAPRTAIAHADVAQARVAWGFPTVDMYAPDMYALDVLANILGDGESSVLVQTLRDDKQLVTSIGASNDTPRWAVGTLDIVAQMAPAKIPEARAALLTVLKDVTEKGVDPAQVEKAKVQVAASLVYGNQTAEQQASRNATDFMATGNIDYSKEYLTRIKAVTPEQVRDAARKYIKPEALLTTVLLPTKVPDSVVVAAAATEVVGAKQPVKKIVLDNGLTVLVDRNPAAPVVTMQYYVLGALLAENDQNNGIGSAMMRLMSRGTKTRSAAQIAEFFDSTGGDVTTSSNNNACIVSATMLKENAAKTFDVFSDVILDPAFAPEELERLRPRLIAGIERSTEDWFGEGYKFLRSSYFKDGPYKRMPVGTVEVVSKLTPEQIRAHYQKFFLNPQRTVLAIYGDVQENEAIKWTQRFARIPKSEATLAQTSEPAAAQTLTQSSRKGSASVFIGYGPGMKVTSDDRYPMIVLQTILGGYNSPGGSVLHETLRGKGLVYVVQASNFAGPVPGMFMIYALGEPGKTDQIAKEIQTQVDRMKAGEFTEEQFKTAIDQAITGEQLQDQTIASQAMSASLDELLGLGYQAKGKFAEKMRAVTKDDVIRVAKAYLQNPVVTITTPAAK